jgi:hypothetical protein
MYSFILKTDFDANIVDRGWAKQLFSGRHKPLGLIEEKTLKDASE